MTKLIQFSLLENIQSNVDLKTFDLFYDFILSYRYCQRENMIVDMYNIKLNNEILTKLYYSIKANKMPKISFVEFEIN